METKPNDKNQEKGYVFSQEKRGAAFVISPEKDLGISRTENNPDELDRVYNEGRHTAEAKKHSFHLFLLQLQ